MPISISWVTSVIHIPKDYTTQIQVSPEIRVLDVNQLRGDVMALCASEEGAPYPTPYVHAGEGVISGDIYARQLLFKPPYMVEFEDGHYTVKCTGANHNISDVRVANSVSLIIGNTAGLIRTAGVDEANVQAAMTTQGYTTERAPKLDALDAAISSRAVPGSAMSLTTGERTLVAAEVVSLAQTSGVLTSTQATQLLELWLMKALSPGVPYTSTPGQVTVGGITINVTESPVGTFTAEREP